MSGQGFILLYRRIWDCWIWEDANDLKRWIDLLMLANHADKKIKFDGELITISRGQYLTSIRKLADRWGCTTKTVRKFLELLESDTMIVRKSTPRATLINIVNYEIYQGFEDEKGTVSNTLSNTVSNTVTTLQSPHSLPTNNNDKTMINNDKEIYCVDFEKVWAIYPRHTEKKKAYSCYKARLKEGFSETELLQATTKYAEECKKDNREQKYIKLASTFFGVNTPFADYLSKDKENMQDGYFIFPIDEYYVENPPYFGFPEEWFKDGQLVTDRIIPIRQLPYKNSGTNKPRDYSKEQLMQMYEERKGWYECNSR